MPRAKDVFLVDPKTVPSVQRQVLLNLMRELTVNNRKALSTSIAPPNVWTASEGALGPSFK
jgi:hypothetical protein